MRGPPGSMTVNLIGLPHLWQGTSVVSKYTQLGGGGVIIMAASCQRSRAAFDLLGPRARHRAGLFKRQGSAFDRDFDGPDRAATGVDDCAAAHLFDKPPHQAEPMPLAFGLGQETGAVIADGHDRELAAGMAHRHGD